MARLSLSEIETLGVKAAVGAGLSYGLAEEAGMAVRWLHARGFNGLGALADYLDLQDGKVRTEMRPAFSSQGLTIDVDRPLCPIALGCALNDFVMLTPTLVDTRLGTVYRPVLVLPFVSQQACSLGSSIDVFWPEGTVTLLREGTIQGDGAGLSLYEKASIGLQPGGGARNHIGSTVVNSIVFPETTTIDRLNVYAMRTTVPASAASRADAGSSTSDNE